MPRPAATRQVLLLTERTASLQQTVSEQGGEKLAMLSRVSEEIELARPPRPHPLLHDACGAGGEEAARTREEGAPSAGRPELASPPCTLRSARPAPLAPPRPP